MNRVAVLVFLVGASLCALPAAALAQSAAELQARIGEHNAQVALLEREIAADQAKLDALGKQKGTLQGAIAALTLSQNQLTAQISVTQNKIDAANLELARLSLAIGDKEATIEGNRAAIGKALRGVAESEATPLVEQLIATENVSALWTRAEQAVEFNRALTGDIERLRAAKTELGKNRDAVDATKTDLVNLRATLASQKRSVDASKAAEQTLLAQTKGQENTYQALLATKRASEKVFEQELLDLQSRLNLIVHPGLLPKTGSGVLSWPFPAAYMANCARRSSLFGNFFCITQYFGNTPFATANPQIYHGHSHNGVDIAANIGTPVVAALSGVVLGAGNTDLARGCYSFGKWVMIKHGNGLNTIYAHLSVIEVASGEAVTTGREIGLSGMTGSATGPHLHFGVYATEGTKLATLNAYLGSTTACAFVTIPIATLDAQLNPLSYL